MKKRLNFDLSEESHAYFKSWCKERGLAMSDVVEFLVHDLINVAPKDPSYLNNCKFENGSLNFSLFYEVFGAIYPDFEMLEGFIIETAPEPSEIPQGRIVSTAAVEA